MEYEVECVVDKKVDNDGTTLYLTKWLGYSSDENTWETNASFISKKPIKDFEAKLLKEKKAREKVAREKTKKNPKKPTVEKVKRITKQPFKRTTRNSKEAAIVGHINLRSDIVLNQPVDVSVLRDDIDAYEEEVNSQVDDRDIYERYTTDTANALSAGSEDQDKAINEKEATGEKASEEDMELDEEFPNTNVISEEMVNEDENDEKSIGEYQIDEERTNEDDEKSIGEYQIDEERTNEDDEKSIGEYQIDEEISDEVSKVLVEKQNENSISNLPAINERPSGDSNTKPLVGLELLVAKRNFLRNALANRKPFDLSLTAIGKLIRDYDGLSIVNDNDITKVMSAIVYDGCFYFVCLKEGDAVFLLKKEQIPAKWQKRCLEIYNKNCKLPENI